MLRIYSALSLSLLLLYSSYQSNHNYSKEEGAEGEAADSSPAPISIPSVLAPSLFFSFQMTLITITTIFSKKQKKK